MVICIKSYPSIKGVYREHTVLPSSKPIKVYCNLLSPQFATLRRCAKTPATCFHVEQTISSILGVPFRSPIACDSTLLHSSEIVVTPRFYISIFCGTVFSHREFHRYRHEGQAIHPDDLICYSHTPCVSTTPLPQMGKLLPELSP